MSYKSYISESGVWPAVVVAYGYIAVYAYEAGYAKAFDMPTDLISPGINNFLFVGAIGISMLALFYQYINLSYEIINDNFKNSIFGKLILEYIIFIVPGILAVILSGFHITAFLFLFILPLLPLFLDLLTPFLDRDEGYVKDLESWVALRKNNPSKNLLSAVQNKSYLRLIIIAFISLYILGIISEIGYGIAKRQKKFMLDKDYVILRIYGSTAILQKYIPSTKEVDGAYKVQNLNELNIMYKKIGPLRPRK